MYLLNRWSLRMLLFWSLILTTLMGGIQIPVATAAGVGQPAPGYTAVRYPIVLVHGLLGFDSILNGVLDYWYKIVPDLRAGGAPVYVTAVSGLNTSEERGEQLASQVRYIMAATGTPKVHLIGHSHGGPTIRYVAGIMPEAVASVTTVAGLNARGQPLTDIAVPMQGTLLGGVVKTFAEGLAKLEDLLSGKKNTPEDAFKAFGALSVKGMADFNARFPAGLPPADCGELHGPELVGNIRYYSWTGNATLTSGIDPIDYVFALTGSMTRLFDPEDKTANDGLVTVCASRLGRQLGVYKQNHLDEINNFWGLVSPFDISPVMVYREHANRLKNLGL
ncbi:MAG: triacylglycerol lipase [Sterolibacterium sp.]|nr:triacylglycerol lipase [Sterolibacterium sp.]MBP9799192.1 triacylglycerol lipase [Sterolibacterium sp.]